MIIQSIIFFTFFLFFVYFIEKFMQEPNKEEPGKEEQLEFKAELKAIPKNHQGENEYNYLRWCYDKGLKPYDNYKSKFIK